MANNTVIVTGAAKGIGKTIAKTFLKQGFRVAANDLDQKALDVFAQETRNSSQIFFSHGNINSPAYRLNLIQETIKQFSTVNVLINNVGVGSGKTVFDIDPSDFIQTLETNLISPFFLSQAVAREMIGNKIKGSIIFISSIHQEIPSGDPAYSSSKAGLKMILKELALKLGGNGIRVNGIAPGRIETIKKKDNRVPLLSESGIAEDIANAVLFLANEDSARYITGEVLTIDGGLSHFFSKKQHDEKN